MAGTLVARVAGTLVFILSQTWVNGSWTTTVGPAKASSALRTQQATSTGLSPDRAQLGESLRAAALLGWAKILYESFTPAEQWLRRTIGGDRKRREIWEEYCTARDALIAQAAAEEMTPSSLRATVLARKLDDLRSEFRVRYAAWSALLFT